MQFARTDPVPNMEPHKLTVATSRIAFVNGHFLPLTEAKVSIMDRGFLFSDGVYEVSAVLDGRLVDNDAHLARLRRSLNELEIPNPYPDTDWTRIEQELVERNRLQEGTVYIEVTRGVAEREFLYVNDLRPTVVAFTQAKNIVGSRLAANGAKIVTAPDLRWARRDIKSIGLLAQVLAKQTALREGAAEVWLVEDGFVTEGGSSTAFIITHDGRIVTRPLSRSLLAGITRQAVMSLASSEGLSIEERAFTVAEAKEAAEAFFTSASNFVIPVVSIDGVLVNEGKVGRLTRRLSDIYVQFARGVALDLRTPR